MEAEGSQAPRHRVKRPALQPESDDEDGDSSPPPYSKGKRRRRSTSGIQDGDLDILVDEDTKPNTSSKAKKRAAEGHDQADQEGDSEISEHEQESARPIGFRPEYQRGADGRVS